MEGLEALYNAARRSLLSERRRVRDKPIRVVLRRFAGLHSVLYDRRDHYELRLSEILSPAPPEVHVSLGKILLARLERNVELTAADRAPYLAWSRSPDVIALHEAQRRSRGRKRLLPATGQVHDLNVLFERLNQEYFGGTLPRPRLGWSPQVSRRLYGHHDPVHDAIVINRLLDHPRVPEAAVAAILHHEMLHVRHGVAYAPSGRRVLHSRAFRQDERRFGQRGEANTFLRALESRKIRIRALPAQDRSPTATPRWSWGTLRAQLFGAAE